MSLEPPPRLSDRLDFAPPPRLGVARTGGAVPADSRPPAEPGSGDRLARLQGVTAALGEALTAAQVADAIMREALPAVGAAAGALWLLAPDGVALHCVAHRGTGDRLVRELRPIPLNGASPVSDATLGEQPVVLEDADAWRRSYPEPLALAAAEAGLPACCCVPLVVDGRALGALAFHFAARTAFTVSDVDFMLVVARQGAQALERARLYEAERSARAHAELERWRSARLQRATADLAGAATPRQVTEFVVQHAVAALGAYGGSIALVDGAELEFVHAAGFPGAALEPSRRIPCGATVPFADAVRSGEPVLVLSLADWRRHYPHLLDEVGTLRAEGLAAFPLRVEGRVIGVLGLAFRQARLFTDEDQAFALALARLAAQALERARLYEAEQRLRREAQQAREAAETANRAKADFLAVMSHELRTPLNAIGGYTQLLELGIPGPINDEQREYLGRIQASQKHLLGLISSVLNFARLEAGHVPFRVEAVSVAALLREVEPLVAPQFHARGLAYRCLDGGSPAIRAYADADKLRQVLLNLVGNAIKFTDAGEVVVSVETTAREVHIHVRDTGPGIDERKMASIFEPFVQGDTSLTRPSEGVGLGLAISRDLAHGMGGSLRLASEVGLGSTFTVVLRRAPDAVP